jgi:dsDNA-specific endonuclease/ATPase MutS2
MGKFNVGEKVLFLKEKGEGKVIEILNSFQVKIEDSDGFFKIYNQADLVKIHGEIDVEDINPPAKEEETIKSKSNYSIVKDNTDSKAKKYWELDLHIESLTDDYRGMSNFDIMKTQLQEFKRFFSKAKSNQIDKIVVIHGVGEGVLKNEIRNYLAQQEFIEFYDASYLEYGKGATEIRMRQRG